jgi:hypothetical protein
MPFLQKVPVSLSSAIHSTDQFFSLHKNSNEKAINSSEKTAKFFGMFPKVIIEELCRHFNAGHAVKR